MASNNDQNLAGLVLDLVDNEDAHWKSMFGGIGLYVNQAMFGLIADGEVYFKTDAENQNSYINADLEPFTFVTSTRTTTMSYYRIPTNSLDSAKEMTDWFLPALAAANRAFALRKARGRKKKTLKKKSLKKKSLKKKSQKKKSQKKKSQKKKSQKKKSQKKKSQKKKSQKKKSQKKKSQKKKSQKKKSQKKKSQKKKSQKKKSQKKKSQKKITARKKAKISRRSSK